MRGNIDAILRRSTRKLYKKMIHFSDNISIGRNIILLNKIFSNYLLFYYESSFLLKTIFFFYMHSYVHVSNMYDIECISYYS